MHPGSSYRPQKLSPFKSSKLGSHHRSPSPSRSRSRNRSPNTSYSSLNTSVVHSEYLHNMFEETEIVPSLCVEMLKNQQKNIYEFKKSIQKEKTRVSTEMETFKVEICHVVEDCKLSLLAIMDKIYQEYITKYSQLKSEILQMNRLKNEIEAEFPTTSIVQPSHKNISNLHTIKTIENTKMEIKRYQILNYVSQMQRQKFGVLSNGAEYLLVLSQYQNGFFQFQEFKQIMDNVKNGFRNEVRGVLENSYQFIRQPENIVHKQLSRKNIYQSSQPQRETPTLPQQLQPPYPPYPPYSPYPPSSQPSYPQPQAQQSMYPQPTYSQPRSSIRRVDNYVVSEREPREGSIEGGQQLRIPGAVGFQSRSQPYIVYQQDDSQIQQMHTQYSHQNFAHQPQVPTLSFQRETFQIGQQTQSQQQNVGSISLGQNPSTQTLLTSYRATLDKIRISESNPASWKSKAMDVILCCHPLGLDTIALGSRDGSLYLYNNNGVLVKRYQNVHKAAICTLSTVLQGRFLVSGSDHPCPQVIVWQVLDNGVTVYCKFGEHKGAVTAAQCLRDSESIISGSYDKRLHIYNIPSQRLSFTLPSNKHSITSISLSCKGNKLLTCSLQNNSLSIWQIVRSQEEKVETIFLEQVIENNTMICALVPSGLRNNIAYIGTKDGRVKVVDVDKGEAIKNMSVGGGAVIEILAVQEQPQIKDSKESGKQSKGLILCWLCKQKCFKIVDLQSGKVANVNTKGYVEFGCGVGPKANVLPDGSGFVVCSQGEDREIYWYKINKVI